MKKLIFILLFFTSIFANDNTKLTILTEDYPPYNMLVDGKVEGIGVDIVEAILKRLDSKQTKDDIILTNWSRAYNLTLKKKNHMVFSTAKTKQREKLFKWVGPVYETSLDLIAPKRKNINIKSLEDIKKYKIGVVLNDFGEDVLLNMGFKENLERVSGKEAVKGSFKKMEKDRIDMFAYIILSAKYSASDLGFDINDYESVYTLVKSSGYLAFNKDTPQSVVDSWQKALDEMKADGTYKKIMDKYN